MDTVEVADRNSYPILHSIDCIQWIILRFDEKVGEFINRQFRERRSIRDGVQDPTGSALECEDCRARKDLLLLMSLIEVVRDVPLELVDQQGSTLCSPPLVANRVLDLDFFELGTVIQLNQECIPDGALRWVMVVD